MGEATTSATDARFPWKSGTRTSTRHAGTSRSMARAVAAKCAAPPSGRSSRLTDVTTTWRRPSRAIAEATRTGSPGSTARGRPWVTAQKPQLRVQVSPSSMKVAVLCPQHSPMLGHRASWQTV